MKKNHVGIIAYIENIETPMCTDHASHMQQIYWWDYQIDSEVSSLYMYILKYQKHSVALNINALACVGHK